MNGNDEGENGGARLGGFYSYKNTFNENNVWVEIPKTGTDLCHYFLLSAFEVSPGLIVTFFNITDPYNMEPTPEPESQPALTPVIAQQLEERQHESFFNMPFDQTSGLEALSTAATTNFQYIRPLSVPVPSPGEAHASPHSSNNLNFILNPTRPETPRGRLSVI
jgi:hypothetical protein